MPSAFVVVKKASWSPHGKTTRVSEVLNIESHQHADNSKWSKAQAWIEKIIRTILFAKIEFTFRRYRTKKSFGRVWCLQKFDETRSTTEAEKICGRLFGFSFVCLPWHFVYWTELRLVISAFMYNFVFFLCTNILLPFGWSFLKLIWNLCLPRWHTMLICTTSLNKIFADLLGGIFLYCPRFAATV